MVCIFTLAFGFSISAEANDTDIVPLRASDYFDNYFAIACTSSNGEIIIEYDLDCTGIMSSIGASTIVIEEKSGGRWVEDETYYGSISNGMLDSGRASFIGSISHDGTPGREYRAVVTFYAEDNYGDDSRTLTTNSVTAEW